MSGLFGKTKTISRTENKLGALRLQNSSQGLPVPLVFGKTRVTSNLLWYGDFTAIAHTTTTKSGGKGGGKQKTKSTTYTYTAGVIFGLCEGPVFQSNYVGQIWSNKDVTTPTKLGLTQFQGTYVQSPWSYLTTNHANQALAYRGDAYVAAGAFDLGSGDGLPNISFEITGLLANGDVNPAAIIDSFLTNDKFGVGWPVASMGNLSHFSDYCDEAGIAISPALIAQTPASSTLEEWARIGNSGVIWSDGLLKIIPYADTQVGSWIPDLTVQYQLTYADFIAEAGMDPVTVERKRQADAYNTIKIECLDRANQYNTYVAEAKDQLAIDLYGLRPKEQISAHAICDANVAKTVAQTILQRELYVRNVYSFTVGWRYARLEPMDIVGLTDPNQGLYQQAVRIISIEEDENGFLAMMAEELQIGVSTPASVPTQQTSGATPENNTPPGNAVTPYILQPPIALSGRPQLWIGSAGGVEWGGAEIWASTDNATFERVGVLPGPAHFGTLTANYPLGADPDVTNTLTANLSVSNGTLSPAANEVADALGTLCWIGGANAAGDEFVAYTTANLTAPYTYAMANYVRRGQTGSVPSAHLTGSKFMRLDNAVASIDLADALMGTTVFIKLLSYNTVGGALQELADVNSIAYNTIVQVVTNGSGYPFYVDKSSTANSDPGNGFMRFNNASQSAATQLYFDNLSAQGVNMGTFFNSVGSAGFLDLRDSTDTNKWATYTITGANSPLGYQTFNVAYTAGGASFANGATVVATFSPTPPTGVTSVGLSATAPIFTVSNSPITSNGTIALTFNTSGANIGAVPTHMGNGVMAWNVPAGGNGGGGNGGIGSIAFNAPTTIFSVANSPLTANGTLDLTFNLTGTSNGMVPTVLGNMVVWANQSGGNGGGGGIGSIALNMPTAIFTVANSPLTSNGVMVVSFNTSAASNGAVPTYNQTANAVQWIVPTSGNGGGGGGNSAKVTVSNVALGVQNAAQTTFNYTVVPSIAARGFIWNFLVTANVPTLFDVVVRGAGNDAGGLRLQGNGVNGASYQVTLPVYWENDAAAQDFYVGIRNRGQGSANFTLTSLGVEKTA